MEQEIKANSPTWPWVVGGIVVLAIAVAVTLSDRGILIGSERTSTETRGLGTFTRVRSEGTGNLIFTVADVPQITISAEENILPQLSAEVQGDTLVLQKKHWWLVFWNRRPIVYTIAVPRLEEVIINGAGDLDGKIQGDELAFRVNGSTHAELTVDADRLDTAVNGSGEFLLDGRADEQLVSINGSGRYLAGDVDCRSATIDINGSGETVVRAAETLSVKIIGSGDVLYSGSPTLTRQEISGSANLQKLSD